MIPAPSGYLSDEIRPQFYLSPHTRSLCSNYFLLYWEAGYLSSLLLSSPRIIRDSIPYAPIFLDGLSECDLSTNQFQQLRLSFRRLRGQKTGYVLISKIVNRRPLAS